MFITGCKIDGRVASTRKYGFQPPINKLYWGMSLDEIEKVLSIKNGVDGVVYIYNKPTTIIKLKHKIRKFGYKATVYMEIFDKTEKGWFPYKSSYLTNVTLVYNKVDAKKVKDNIIKEYNNNGNDWVNVLKNDCTTWLSDDKIKDIKPDEKKKLENLWKIIDEHSYKTNNIPILSAVKDENKSINTIVLENSKKGVSVSFAGETAVQINQVIKHK
jgi:hypothetical protein